VTPIPALPGSYLLLLELPAPARLPVGRLGEYDFPAGFYLYCGSAFGPGGLAARLGRHLNPQPPLALHWHIDYLRARAAVIAHAWQTGQQLECAWAQALFHLGGQAVVPAFGSSDCRSGCPAHLLFFAERTAARDAFEAVAHAGGQGRSA
jgi:Uri superfamily endonuclease